MSSELILVDVARDFTRTPGGRYEGDGPGSGEEFRRRLLEPVLDAGGRVAVDLDGALGFGSSFLEEVFGGLVRKYGADDMRARVEVRAESRPERAARAVALRDRAGCCGGAPSRGTIGA